MWTKKPPLNSRSRAVTREEADRDWSAWFKPMAGSGGHDIRAAAQARW